MSRDDDGSGYGGTEGDRQPSALAIALDTSTTPDVLSQLGSEDRRDIRWAVAGHQATPPDVLRRLANDPSAGVRRAIARNSSTPHEVLLRLAGSKDRYVRQRVASNPSASVETLAQLGNDDVMLVRYALAGNPSTPPSTLQLLSGDSHPAVIEALLSNPAAPASLIERLSSATTARSGFAGESVAEPDSEFADHEMNADEIAGVGPRFQSPYTPQFSGRLQPGPSIGRGTESDPAIETPAGPIRLYVRAVETRQVAANLARDRDTLVHLADLLLEELDERLRPTEAGGDNSPPERVEIEIDPADIELRDRLQRFRDSLAETVVSDPDPVPVIESGRAFWLKFLENFAAEAGTSVGKQAGPILSTVGVCGLLYAVGIPAAAAAIGGIAAGYGVSLIGGSTTAKQ